jgi:hypothetical protein
MIVIRACISRSVFALLAACLLMDAQSGPRPPCANGPVPTLPGLNDPAVVKSWSKSDYGRDWSPPICTGWAATGFTTLVTIAARFRYTEGGGGLLRRIGAISELTGLRYWSATHKQWQTLIVEAHALTGSQTGQHREDFTSDEIKQGKAVYFEQVDNLSGTATYRLHVAEASADRVVFDVENVSRMRYLLIPVFDPGEMQSVYFFEREGDGVWRYYSIMRTGKNANALIARNKSSAINRAVAFYRYLAGIPSAQEPPAAQ